MVLRLLEAMSSSGANCCNSSIMFGHVVQLAICCLLLDRFKLRIGSVMRCNHLWCLVADVPLLPRLLHSIIKFLTVVKMPSCLVNVARTSMQYLTSLSQGSRVSPAGVIWYPEQGHWPHRVALRQERCHTGHRSLRHKQQQLSCRTLRSCSA